MEIIDAVPAGTLEDTDIGLTVLIDNTEYEIRSISETDDIEEVSITVYNLSTGDVETLPVPFDYIVTILGA